MLRKVKIFIIEIEIEQDQWFTLPNKQPFYKKGQRIMIPIKTSSAYHAEMKFENNYWGSEMPPYHIVSIHKCDNGGLFAADRFFNWR
jgi:hypothetical protein